MLSLPMFNFTSSTFDGNEVFLIACKYIDCINRMIGTLMSAKLGKLMLKCSGRLKYPRRNSDINRMFSFLN